jgi:hypothetical protein
MMRSGETLSEDTLWKHQRVEAASGAMDGGGFATALFHSAAA